MGPTQAVERDRLGPVGHRSQSQVTAVLLFSHVSAFFSLGLTVLTPPSPLAHFASNLLVRNPQRDCGSSLGTESLVWPGSGVQSLEGPPPTLPASAKDHQEHLPGKRFMAKPEGASEKIPTQSF